jgi:hypothetical protein
VDNISGYKGVTPESHGSKKWVATIYVNGKNKRLGAFDTCEEASRTYQEAAARYYGEFARKEPESWLL